MPVPSEAHTLDVRHGDCLVFRRNRGVEERWYVHGWDPSMEFGLSMSSQPNLEGRGALASIPKFLEHWHNRTVRIIRKEETASARDE